MISRNSSSRPAEVGQDRTLKHHEKYMEYRIQFALDTWGDGLGIELLRTFRMFSLGCLDVTSENEYGSLVTGFRSW